MKECFKCHSVLPLSEFYKHKQMSDGHLNKCKACTKKDTSANRSDKIEYYLEYDRMRAAHPERVSYRKAYAKTERGKATVRKCSTEWIIRNPEKRKAHSAVSNSIRDGRLQKQPCMVCGALRAEAHHEDYSKPLDVTWLCTPCHAGMHAKGRNLPALSQEDLKSGRSKYLQ